MLDLFFILLIWGRGVRTHPTHPPVYGPDRLTSNISWRQGYINLREATEEAVWCYVTTYQGIARNSSEWACLYPVHPAGIFDVPQTDADPTSL